MFAANVIRAHSAVNVKASEVKDALKQLDTKGYFFIDVTAKNNVIEALFEDPWGVIYNVELTVTHVQCETQGTDIDDIASFYDEAPSGSN